MGEGQLPIDKASVVKPLVESRGFKFNLFSLVVIPIVWPHLSVEFRSSEYAAATVTAWSLVGNSLFRMLTRTRALRILGQMEEDMAAQVREP